MNKRIFLAASALFLALTLSAQNYTGGVKGTVVSRLSKATIDGADLILYSEGKEVARVKAGQDGTFQIGNLKDGMYDLVIESPDYLQSRVNVTVNDGYVKNMFNLSLTPVTKVAEVDDASFSEFDMDDSGYQDSPTILSVRTMCSTTWPATISVPCASVSAAIPVSHRMSILLA